MVYGLHALGSEAAGKGVAAGVRSFVGPGVSAETEKSNARREPQASLQP
jgi:hypothetical protein